MFASAIVDYIVAQNIAYSNNDVDYRKNSTISKIYCRRKPIKELGEHCWRIRILCKPALSLTPTILNLAKL